MAGTVIAKYCSMLTGETMSITKTVYPTFRKVVLDNNITTGIMIGQERYEELQALGMTDEQMFEAMRY